MKALTAFLPRLMPWVNGCPEPVAIQALLDSCIEFCEQTNIVRSTTAGQDVVVGQGVYTVPVPAQQAIVSTRKAWYGTAKLNPAADTEIDNILAYVNGIGTETARKGTPNWYLEVSAGQVGLYPVPDQSLSNMLIFRISTKPTRAATTVEDILFEDWVEAIVYGARYRLHAMPGQFFTSDAKAGQSETQFRLQINKAKNIASRGRVQGSLSVQMRPF